MNFRFACPKLNCILLTTVYNYSMSESTPIAGVMYEEVNESNTTQTCSSCGEKPPSRPKGIAGLGIREWICSDCGTVHDRDVNAAKNILALGHERLAVGIPVLSQ